jgi:hypothetical protein
MRANSQPGNGFCGLLASPMWFTATYYHEARHTYQASISILPNNDVDGDFLVANPVPVDGSQFIQDTPTVRNVCNQDAPQNQQVQQKGYKGDTGPNSFDQSDAPDWASWAWEMDAFWFAYVWTVGQ